MIKFYVRNNHYEWTHSGYQYSPRALIARNSSKVGYASENEITVIYNFLCHVCRGRSGSGELTMNKACDKHQSIMAAIVMIGLDDLKRRGQGSRGRTFHTPYDYIKEAVGDIYRTTFIDEVTVLELPESVETEEHFNKYMEDYITRIRNLTWKEYKRRNYL